MIQLAHFTAGVTAQKGKGILFKATQRISWRQKVPRPGLRPTHLSNRTMMHLNHFQVGTEEMHIWSSSSYHTEDFLIYISVWKSWMPLYLPHFHGPLVNMASISVTSLYSCPSFLHPISLTRIENVLQLFSISEEGTEFLIPN